MQIQWYPGHMAKALREVKKDLGLVDMVIEMVDARIPASSRNPQLQELAPGKERIVVLNKMDLADDALTKTWLESLRAEGMRATAVNSTTGDGFKELHKLISQAASGIQAKWLEKGRNPRPARAMVVGVPNVGKSAFINKMAGKSAAKAEDRPGVTRGRQWVKIGTVDLMDTPGILWPKFENQENALKLALVGTINENLLDQAELARNLITTLEEAAPGNLDKRFKINAAGKPPQQVLQEIAGKRGCLVAGGQPDYDKTARLLLKEFRSGLIGKYTLDCP